MEHSYDKKSPESIFNHANQMLDRCLRDVITEGNSFKVAEASASYGKRRKGYLGDLVEEHVFGIKPNSSPGPDFPDAGVELKTTPLKTNRYGSYIAKERLVFSMIDYMQIINETWEDSSFLKKNKMLLLMFYLYKKESELLDYEFKIIRLLSLLCEISSNDFNQIKSDWEFIVDKIKRGEAHKLSEGDTFYLGACTKSSSSSNRREQPVEGAPPAKPRAFSLKQSYLNYIIKDSLKKQKKTASLFKGHLENKTIDEYINNKFVPFVGLKDIDIQHKFSLKFDKRPKNYRRLLVNKILGVHSNNIEELEKADVTLRVIALEKSGNLKESISFPCFDYCELVEQTWEESDFYLQLNSRRFLFVVFRKIDNDVATLEKIRFWNFPVDDLDSVKSVWEKTVLKIKQGKADGLPKIKDNPIAHVRPHGRDKEDTLPTPYGTREVKKCFWLNAKYVQSQIAD